MNKITNICFGVALIGIAVLITTPIWELFMDTETAIILTKIVFPLFIITALTSTILILKD